MNIFITGICGFLGSHLADRLKLAHNVMGCDDLSGGSVDNLQDLDFIQERCSELPYDALDGVDVLVHTACHPHEGLSSFSPYLIGESVYTESMAVISDAIQAGVRRIVFLSSMARYGNQISPFAEHMPTKPVDPYGVAKVAVEQSLHSLAVTHGIEYSIVVPHNIIGTRQRYTDPYRNVVSIMMNRMKQGKQPIVYGKGDSRRCFSPIADVLPTLEQIIVGDQVGVWNVGPDDDDISILNLARKLNARFTPERPFDPIHVAARPREVRFAFCSSKKIRKDFGYRRVQGLEECLDEMWAAMTPQPFEYYLPVEIQNEYTPKTWTQRLI